MKKVFATRYFSFFVILQKLFKVSQTCNLTPENKIRGIWKNNTNLMLQKEMAKTH
jgi:hypothetical protein